MRLLVLLVALTLILAVWADTEIVNIRVPLPDPPVSLPHDAQIRTLSPVDERPRQRRTEGISLPTVDGVMTPGTLYFVAALPEGAWTCRVSHPASNPARYTLSPFVVSRDDPALAKYRDLRPVEGGQMVAFRLEIGALSPSTIAGNFSTVHTFHILVEPLWLGVVPRTARSAVLAIVGMAGAAAWVAPKALKRLAELVDWIDRDEVRAKTE